MQKSKAVAVITLMFLILACFNPACLAASFGDISNHWAKDYIAEMVDQGIISGYPDGTFKPEGKITRAEFASLLVRGFQLPIGGSKVFSDTANHWAKDFIAAAYSQGIISGYSEYEFGPDDPITREQMAVMIVKAARPDADVEGKTFADNNSIADWARQAVIIATGNNIISGYPDNTFRPKGNTTRAEAAVVLNQTLSLKTPIDETPTIPEEDYSVIDEDGIYGPYTGTETVEGSVTIESPDVTLRNLIITGNLIIAEEVGDGDVTLDNVTVKGKTYIRGGGKDSIYIDGGQYNEVIVEKIATKAVRIVAEDVKGLKITIAKEAAGKEIILKGDIDFVSVRADDIKVTTQADTNINEIRVQSGLDDVDIYLDEGTIVDEMVLYSAVAVQGKGKIKEASGSKAKESSFATEPGRVTAPPAGGGGGGSSSTAVSAISVEGVAKVGETLTAKVTPEKATVTYKWMRADAEDGEYVAIAGATDKTYTLSEADAGKWIKVEVKGTGNYTGTKSKVVGPVEEVEEPIETIEAIIDYNAVWNESRGTWYIKVTVPDENLDAGSVKSIHAITEAGVDLDEPRELTPDTDTVMWFGVAKGDGEVTLKRDGKYAYKVVRQDDSEYIFSFDYAANKVQGEINLVQAALQAVNVAEDRNTLKEVIEEKAAILGLDLTDYNTLIDNRKPSVSSDLLSNKPEDGYDLATLQEYFNAIVATRHATQASMDKVNNAKSIADLDGISWVTALLAQFKAADEVYDYHSGILLTEKINTLQVLVTRYEALPPANQEAALQAVLAGAPYARSQATTEALDAALTKQEDIIGQVGAALQAVNVAEDRNTLKEVIEEKAAILGLDLTDYNTLIDNRKPSVSSDLLSNKPEDGYDLATLQEYFDAIVATRHATQASMDKVNNAKSIADLEGISWVTALLAQFEAADKVYDYHSGIALSEKISTLQDLVGRYNALPEANQEAALEAVLKGAPYARSQATTEALDAALTEQEDIIGQVQAALQAVNDAGTTAAMQAAIEDNAAVLGLDMESYNELIEARQPSVSVDLVANKGEGYTLDSLKKTFNAIVATRHATQASMDKVNNAESIADLEGISWVTALLTQFEAADEVYDYHSGIALSEKIATLQGLVDRYNSLDEAGQAAVLQKLLAKRPEDGYARSQATTDALAEALTEVEEEQDAIAQALAAVNDYLTPANYNYAGAPDALEEHLAVLGLDVGEDSAYAALDKTASGGKNRKTAVFYDLNQNKPDEGYDLATLTTYFNNIVATRLVTEKSMDLVNNAQTIEDLEGISFVTMLLDRFRAVSYQTHSGIPVKEKIATLQGLVERYNSLDEAGKTAVLQKLLAKRPEDGYARSQATTDALAEALTEVEEEPVASTYQFSYEVPDKVIAGESYTVPVTIEPETEGTVGYERVRFDVEVTTPDGATLQLLAEDTNGVVHDLAQIGYWGPENGFPIDANYSETTDFRAIFSAAGKYSITFSLVDLDADKVLITETVEITDEPSQDEIDAAKAAFLEYLEGEVEKIDVAEVDIDGPEDETKSDDTSEIGENEVKEIIEERAVETDGVEAEGDEEFVEETDNVEESGEENQETPVVEEEDNEDMNDEAEVESGGEEDAA